MATYFTPRQAPVVIDDAVESDAGDSTEAGDAAELNALLAAHDAEAAAAEANLSPEMKQLLEKIETIEGAMLANDPNLRSHLANTHEYLRQFPELTHLLSPEDIGRWMRGQQKAVGMSLLADALAPKKAGSKSTPGAKKLGVNDIF